MKNLNGKYFVAMALLLVAGSVVAMEGSLDEQLLKAARQGNTREVKRLIKAGADVNAAKDRYGESPLHRSVYKPNATETIRALIAAKAKVNAKDIYGSTPLHIAAAGDNLKNVQALLNGGADPTIKDNVGRTPLENAKRGAKNKEIIELLQDYPAYATPPKK